MAKFVTLLGFVAGAEGAALGAALNAVPGPAVRAVYAGGLAALVQAEGAGGLLPRRPGAAAALQALRTVQCRLEAACQRGPFLPADPAHARCRAGEVESLLEAASPSIAAALGGPGTRHQWDVVLRWPEEAVVAARRAEISAETAALGGGRGALAEAVREALARERTMRESALRAALARVALASLPAGSGMAETGVTVLLPAGAEAVLDAALQSLPDAVTADAEADLRGPLPPVSFAAVRIDSAAPAELEAAWKTLALPDRIDAAALRRHWRATAARLHPDHGVASDAPIVQAGAAFRLLRGLLAERAAAPTSLPVLQRETACRLRVQFAAPDLAA